ncbi:MAG: hypothetical protein GWN58_49065, partial [Anaerolineae bacterium]|nr:hypothetical protein [Anaerolineae bacterium]
APPSSEPTQSQTPDVLIRVGEFQFTNSSATLVTEKWGEQALSLPAINLNNIGGAKGVPPDQFAKAVFDPLLKKINRAVEEG